MPNTYTQIFLQFVFAVSRRQCLIPRAQKERLHEYIGGLVLHRGSKPLAIHCMPDHAHIFIGYKPTIAIPDLVKEIKVESNEFINDLRWTPHRFSWQEGYGAFTVSASQRDMVREYIAKQEEHHRKRTFQEEYVEFLIRSGVEYEDRYLW